MASPGVKGAIARYGADLLAIRDLVEKFGQDRAVALPAEGELHRPDVACRGIHGQMDFAVLASAVRAVLPGQPRAVAEKLDPGAVHQEVQGGLGSAERELDSDRLLASAERGKVRYRPVQPCHLEDAGNHARRLPERQAEEHLHHQAELDGRVGEYGRTPRLAEFRSEPGHVPVQPE